MESNNTTNEGSHGGLIGVIVALLVIVVAAGTYLYYNQAIAPSTPEETATTTPSELASNCGLFVDSPKAGDAVSFPLTITGKVDNSNAQSIGCSWSMFEGQAGTASLYYETKDGWSLPVDTQPLKVDNWTSTSTPFTTTLNFDNKTQEFPAGYNFKIVFTEENPSGKAGADSVEIPVVLK